MDRLSVFLDRVAHEINDHVFGVTERQRIKGSNFNAQASVSSRKSIRYTVRSYIVSVSVSANDIVVKTWAMLDRGSTRTLCARQLMKQVNITGDDAEINLETLNDHKNIAASCVTLEIKGRHIKWKPILMHKVLAVYGFPKLESGIVSQEEVGQCDLLFHKVDQQYAGYDSEVLILIGQDRREMLRPLEIRRGGDQEPYVIRTTL